MCPPSLSISTHAHEHGQMAQAKLVAHLHLQSMPHPLAKQAWAFRYQVTDCM